MLQEPDSMVVAMQRSSSDGASMISRRHGFIRHSMHLQQVVRWGNITEPETGEQYEISIFRPQTDIQESSCVIDFQNK